MTVGLIVLFAICFLFEYQSTHMIDDAIIFFNPSRLNLMMLLYVKEKLLDPNNFSGNI
jgi:hypothetical protein